LDFIILLLVECIVFLAALVGGLTGFGFALVLAPNLMLLLSPKTAIPVVTLLSVVLNSILFYEAREWANPREIRPLLLSGLLGMLCGALLLIYLNVPLLKLLTGAVIIPFAIALLLDVKIELNSRLLQVPVGLLSGFLGGSTSMSGPPVVLFFQNRGFEKRVFRANLIVYFFLIYPLTLPTYYLGGLLTGEVFSTALLAAPVMVVGALLGARHVHRVNEGLFRRITLLLVIASGVFSIVTGLGLF
jgi:uncharacterized membrane protein YfcA